MIYPSNFETKLGFDHLRNLLSKYCIAQPGRDEVQHLSFSDDFVLVQRQLLQVSEMIYILDFHDEFPVPVYEDIRPVMKKSLPEGAWIELEELRLIQHSLESVKSLLVFFKRQEEDKFPALRAIMQGVKNYPEVLKKIDAIMDETGHVRDSASPELGHIRQSARIAQEHITRTLGNVLRQAQREGWAEEDTGLTMRDGRMVIPVNAVDKRKVKGFVHDESSTGKTVFIEPAEAVELNNRLRELELAERREIIRILSEFTAFIRPYAPELMELCSVLGRFDMVRAKALLARKLNAVIPVLRPEPGMEWHAAVHPILYLRYSQEKKVVVPLDITLNQKNRILVISGPNAGGKSVCLQTVGLLQYMIQCGLPVPASPNSVFGMFNDIFLDIGDEQSIENDLSTYSSHLLHMKNFLKQAGPRTIGLIDEFGAGTEPMLGGAIAEAILGKLVVSGCYGVITTHYTNLKHFAASTEGVMNGAMQFDSGQMQPLFRLVIGKPGSSFAFEIARRIGLPEDILEAAKARVGSEHIDFDRHLKEVLRDKQYWERKREHIRISSKKLEETLDKYSRELEETAKLRRQVLDKAKAEAGELVAGINKKIENTIREIKEAGAEKEKTKKLRKDLEEYTAGTLDTTTSEDSELAGKKESLKNKRPQTVNAAEKEKQEGTKMLASGFQKGDKVRMVNQNTVGEVLDVNGRSILVAFGSLITTLDDHRLEKAEDTGLDQLPYFRKPLPQSVNVGDRRLHFKPEIDIRGHRGDEALQLVQQFLDEALMVGSTEVRILHGKGNGILRQLIRDYLRVQNFVASFADEHVERGGAGITVVKLEG